jgi:hypothetical protein
MKLILQIAAGIVLGWLIISATQAILAYTALAKFAKSMQTASPLLQIPHKPSPEPSLNQTPYQAPPITQPLTREQLDAYIHADEARAKADHDAAYGGSPQMPVKEIRKATPADAAAKPPK